MYTIPQIKLTYVSDGVGARRRFTSASDIEKAIRDSYEPGEIEFREHFKAVYLNRANKIIGIQTISIGGTDCTVVDRKIIFSGALLSNASGIIISHNHPSGNSRPSVLDDKITQEVKSGCETLGLKLLDHIIITAEGFYSYNDEGRL